MLTNTTRRRFDVIEVTNEMPTHRMGGVGTVMESLMSGLRAEGVRPLWFVTDHAYRPAQLEALLARFPDVAIGSADDLDAFHAPLLHVHSYQQNPALHARLCRRRTIYTVHSLLAFEESSNGVELNGAVQGQEAMIALARCVVLLSESERAKYRALGYEALNPRVRVIHNGVGCAAPYRAPRGKRVLGFCGRLVPRKHPEYVQWMLTEPGFETRRVLIAGRGFSPYARDLLERHALGERVRFLGWCAGARLEAFFDAIDMLAVPTIYEPFGLVALEAAARGIPVVCPRTDGLVDVLGEHAFHCEDTSYEAFRAAMYRWDAATPEALAAVSAGARARYLAAFTDVAMARRYRALFGELTATAAWPQSRPPGSGNRSPAPYPPG
ncbi:glycosyltransferase family 4 protein [Nitrogeniibacter mangrovi]|uniref:Glycosyltransferase family 4 protein n=1 Tax=Nitrogeniibacter mangrovi TaxID=2016596 RepID=A0A6C1B482_9RHOO|nr:glycosyltransferase family 4 protein [Nitrogeniibacter mangrovi]QID17675.1 glycosyltransferase family 4 protein [Nitrogeniibacter mangrovi]